MLYRLKNVVKTRKRDVGYRLLIRALAIEKNAKIALTGPSGCGKSTTLDLLGLSLAPDSAENFTFSPAAARITVMNLWQHGAHNELARLRLHNLGYVLQSGELLPFLTTGENMCLTARLSGMSKREAEASARALADSLGIGSLWTAMPETLSVGERQRAAIVRAIAARPHAVLADEPTAALDSIHAARVMELFLDCLSRYKCALVLVTHNPAWAASGGFREAGFELQESAEGVTAVLDDKSQ